MTLTRRTFVFAAASAMLSALLASPASADERQELRQRFKQRFAAILKLKDAGRLGETSQGYLAVPPQGSLDNDSKALMEQENADRRRLYELIAAETGASPELVGQRNGQRNFDEASKGHWLRQGNQWRQK